MDRTEKKEMTVKKVKSQEEINARASMKDMQKFITLWRGKIRKYEYVVSTPYLVFDYKKLVVAQAKFDELQFWQRGLKLETSKEYYWPKIEEYLRGMQKYRIYIKSLKVKKK